MNEYGIKHPHKQDFEAGRNDGSETNPYCNPDGRDGDALIAYMDGFEEGRSDHDQYLDEQEYQA